MMEIKRTTRCEICGAIIKVLLKIEPWLDPTYFSFNGRIIKILAYLENGSRCTGICTEGLNEPEGKTNDQSVRS